MSKIVVIGAGNAGLCAALSGKQNGADVVVVESAPQEAYGSDSFFSGGLFRLAYDDLDEIEGIVGSMDLGDAEGLEQLRSYPESEFLQDWGRLTGYRCDLELCDLIVSSSKEAMGWLAGLGVPFQSPIIVDDHGRARHSRPGWHGGFLEASGAGPGLTGALLSAAVELGVPIRYGTSAEHLEACAGPHRWVLRCRTTDGEAVDLAADNIVIASGGFQGDVEWRTRCLGPGWDLAKVRGCVFNTGQGFKIGFSVGAASYGNWSGCHAVAWSVGSGEAGRRDANHVFERESYPFGITVNRDGVRFVDEGSDYGAYTYAKYGRQILHQPEQRAWQLFDAQSASLLTSEYRYKNPEAARITAKSIEELADLLGTHGLQADAVSQTIRKFNAAVLDNSPFSPYEKDGRRTKGLATEKTNWARGLTQPPFEAYEVTCGITFTFGGLRIDTDARVLDHGGRCIAGLYACGESVGGLYYFNYGSGTGLTSGAVLGRIAGRRAAVN